MKQFTSTALNKSATVEFELDGVGYSFACGKKAGALMALLVSDTKSQSKELDRIAQILDWFSNGLNKDHNKKHNDLVEGCQACDVQKRLADDDDPLEFDTVVEVATWLIGESSSQGNSRTGS